MEIGNTVREAIDGFKLHGELKECIRYGSGHINDTYRLTYETSQGTKRYILQRMSRNIFKKPVELMENISVSLPGSAKRSSRMAAIRNERH